MTQHETQRPIRVVLADDHAVVRAGIKAELGPSFEVVGEADNADGAVDVITAHRPDLVICDLHMPMGGGLAVVRACAKTTPIVILTVSEAERDLLDAVAEGAAGYLVKSMPIDDLRAALIKAASGEPVFSPSLAALVLGEFRRMSKQAGSSPLADTPTAKSDSNCLFLQRRSKTTSETFLENCTCLVAPIWCDTPWNTASINAPDGERVAVPPRARVR
jgi:DNA-binding NarL/FixJ family response regulator